MRPKRPPTGSRQGRAGPADPAPPSSPVDGVVLVLTLMMALAPALGVPHEYLLQDTLKSVVVGIGSLLAGLVWCWQRRSKQNGPHSVLWHGLLGLPLALMAYALASMAWSHTYLAGVEAVRWFIFSLILWLGLNTFTRERLPLLALGIHAGALIASLWAVLQFWFDFEFFPQGPNPASTFVNRNFFAEFAVCTLPLSALLIARAQGPVAMALLALGTGLTCVAVLMTGTRSALLALGLLALTLPVALYRWRQQLAFVRWQRGQAALLAVVLAATVLGLGLIPSGNPALEREFGSGQGGQTALSRALLRGQSVVQGQEYTTGSFSVRMVMWQATARMMATNPLAGVGAGAWEVDIALYQAAGTQLETDFYAHNEILQLLAEYGLVGALFLIGLLAYLARAAWLTWRSADPHGAPNACAVADAPWRAVALISLAMFLLVSNAGFPWRMASTGALFALLLAVLAASDLRGGQLEGPRGWAGPRTLAARPLQLRLCAAALALCMALAVYMAQQAGQAERTIVHAVKLALAVSESKQANDPRWAATRRELLSLVQQGIAVNPHYRKLTPMVADEMAKWGDWKNAILIWDSVVQSRPYVVAILTNIARGHAQMGQLEQAKSYLDRARKVRPDAPAVLSLEVILLANSGREPEALDKIRLAMAQNRYDLDLLNAAYLLGTRAQDWPLAIRALEMRIRAWPATAVDGWVKLARLHSQPQVNEPEQALKAWRAAIAAAPPAQRESVQRLIPQPYLSQL